MASTLTLFLPLPGVRARVTRLAPFPWVPMTAMCKSASNCLTATKSYGLSVVDRLSCARGGAQARRQLRRSEMAAILYDAEPDIQTYSSICLTTIDSRHCGVRVQTKPPCDKSPLMRLNSVQRILPSFYCECRDRDRRINSSR